MISNLVRELRRGNLQVRSRAEDIWTDTDVQTDGNVYRGLLGGPYNTLPLMANKVV